MATTIQFSSDADPSPSGDLQAVELDIEQRSAKLPSETIPADWKQLLEEEGVDIAGIEWWEAPSPLFTFGKQAFYFPMQFFLYFIISVLFLIVPFPVNIIISGIYSGYWFIPTLLAPIFILLGVLYLIFIIVFLNFLAEFTVSIGACGKYFYAITPRLFVIAYRAYPIPYLSSRLPSSVTSIPYDNKYFRGDIRWNGTGSILLPSAYMTVDQKKQCTGGKGGFLFISDVQAFLAKINGFTSGCTDLNPKIVPYRNYYVGIHSVLGIVFLFIYLAFTLASYLSLRLVYALSFQTFGFLILLLAGLNGYCAFYWWKHKGIIHINSPPNQPHDPICIFYTLYSKIKGK